MNEQATLKQVRRMLALGKKLGRDFSDDIETLISHAELTRSTNAANGRPAAKADRGMDLRAAVFSQVKTTMPHWKLMEYAAYNPEFADELPF